LFLYAGLAMLENILRAKGSNIRPWYSYMFPHRSIMTVMIS